MSALGRQFPRISELGVGIHHAATPVEIKFINPRVDRVVDLPHNTPVYSSQEHYNPETVSHFMANPPDPRGVMDGRPNMPQLIHHKGKLWMGEGHHRLIASRLGEGSTTRVAVHDVNPS